MVRPSTSQIWFNTHPSSAGTWSTTTAGQLCDNSTYVAGQFGSTDGCPKGAKGAQYVTSNSTCSSAAASLGYTFAGSGSWAADYPGCMVRPSTSQIWFNTHSSPSGTWSTTTAGQLCHNAYNTYSPTNAPTTRSPTDSPSLSPTPSPSLAPTPAP